MEEAKPPKVFISYSWEDDAHNQWVKDFVAQLRKDGVEAILDEHEVSFGKSLTFFMENGLTDNDFVLLICTPIYKTKFDQREGGVGYEAEIITGHARKGRKNREKFLSVLRKGELDDSVPKWMPNSKYVNLTNNFYDNFGWDNDRIGAYTRLLAHLYGDHSLDEVGERKDLTGKDLTSQELKDAREKYLQYIIDTNQFVGSSVRRLAGLKLDELYVTVTKRISEAVSVANAVHDNTLMIILGNPGSGKTTLMRFLALHFAKTMQNNQDSVVDKENNNYGSALLPISLRVAYFANALTKNRSLALKDYLLENCDGGEAEKHALRQLLSNALKEDKALVLLDGLDEIVDAGVRAETVRCIERFVSAYNWHTHIVVTSRISGNNYPLNGNFVDFQLCELGRSEIEKYLSRIEKEFGIETEKLLHALDDNPEAGKLATNQLMLAVMVDVFEKDKMLPVRRVELYEKAINILVNEWQINERGLSERVVKSYEILDLLAPLAYWIHATKADGLASEKEVINKLVEFWAEANDAKPSHFEVQEKVKAFFERAIDTGILIKVPDGKYSFVHLTFQEYLAACDIVRRENETARLIYDYRHSARWEEIILLAIAYVSSTNPERAEKLIREAVLAQNTEDEGFYPSELEEILHRDSLLAVRCISESIGLSNEFCFQTLNHLLNIYFDVEGSGKYIPLIERILHTMEGIGNSDVAGNIEQLLLNKLKNKENDKIRCILALISLGRNTKEIEEALIICLRDESEYVRRQAAEALGKLKLDSHESIRALLDCLQDKEVDVQVKAVEALGELNNADEIVVNVLLQTLERNDLEVEGIAVKRAALIALAKLCESNSEIEDVLFNLLIDPYMGDIAAETLGKLALKDEKIVGKLLEILKGHIHQVVQERIALAFENLGQAFPTTIILSLMEDPEWYVRCGAVCVLGKSGNKSKEVLDALISALTDKERYVRDDAKKALEQSEVTSELVIKFLEKQSELKSFIGLNGFFEKWARKDTYNVEKGLLLGLRHNNSWVRLNSVQVLSALETHSPQFFLEILDVLKNDENKDVRLKTIEVLGRIGFYNDDLIDGLVGKLIDDDWRARQASIWALERLGVKSGKIITGLLNVLRDEDEDEFTRKCAADALGNLGVDTYNVIEGLQYVIDNSGSHHVMLRTAKALRQLGKKLDPKINDLVDEYFDEKYEEHKQFMDLSFIMNNLILNTWLTRKELTEDFAGRIKRERNFDFKWVYMEELAERGIKHPDAEVQIIKEMKSQDRDLRLTAVEAAGNLQIETSDSIGCLISLLQDSDDEMRMRVIEALGKMDGKFQEIWEGLIQSMEDNYVGARYYAIKGLGKLSGDQSKNLNSELQQKIKLSLIKALSDPRNVELYMVGFSIFPIYHSVWESLLQVAFVP